MAVDPAVQIKVTSIVCSVVAISTTIYRLIIRRRRLWADDAWACFSMASLIVQVVAVYLDVRKNTTQRYKVVRYYMMANAFYCIIWSARLSILFSMIRIDPSRTRQRRLACVGAAFFTTWVLLVAQLFWVCEPNNSWKKLKTPQCPLDEQVAIFQLVSDVIADLILLIAPLRLLAVLRDDWLRYRLMVIFSTCIVTTIVSLVHAVYILTTAGGPKVIISALVEDCISLIVCNIPVVITAFVNLNDASELRRQGRLPSFLNISSFEARPDNMTIPHELSRSITIVPVAVLGDTRSHNLRKAMSSTDSVGIFHGSRKHNGYDSRKGF